jgi:hypothetical protein
MGAQTVRKTAARHVDSGTADQPRHAATEARALAGRALPVGIQTHAGVACSWHSVETARPRADSQQLGEPDRLGTRFLVQSPWVSA